MSCRAVYVAIPVCVAGVILITQPSFLGHVSEHRSMLGVTLAVGQVVAPLHDQQLLLFFPTSWSKHLSSCSVAVQLPVLSCGQPNLHQKLCLCCTSNVSMRTPNASPSTQHVSMHTSNAFMHTSNASMSMHIELYLLHVYGVFMYNLNASTHTPKPRNVTAAHTSLLLASCLTQHAHITCAFLQACFSACAKMCVRELRKTDTANVSVFYLSLCSTIGATIGLGASMLWGSGQGLMVPHAWDWALFAGMGNIHSLLGSTECIIMLFVSVTLKFRSSQLIQLCTNCTRHACFCFCMASPIQLYPDDCLYLHPTPVMQTSLLPCHSPMSHHC